jgi:hypothetical protein
MLIQKKVDKKLANPTSVQWPKLCIGLDVEADIQILKDVYIICIGVYRP